MKRLLLALLLASNTAQAQIPVTDAINFGKDVVHYATVVTKWVDQYNQLNRQFTELKETKKALSGVRNLADVFDNPRLRQLLPDDMRVAYRDLRSSGFEGLVRKGVEIHDRNKVYERCNTYTTNDMRKHCEAPAANTAQMHGDAEDAMSVIVGRTKQIEKLQGQINDTADVKAVADIQARIAVEQATIENEAARIMVWNTLDDTQQRLDADRQKQVNARALASPKGFADSATVPTFGR